MAQKGIETMIAHLGEPDVAKKRVALGVLEDSFKKKLEERRENSTNNNPAPPNQIVRPLLMCMCMEDPPEVVAQAVRVLDLIIKTWPTYGSHIINENMGLAILWLFSATYEVKEVASVVREVLAGIAESSMQPIQSETTTKYFEILSEARKWQEHCVGALAQQILEVTKPPQQEKPQKIIEKESNTVPLLTYFFTFLNDTQALNAESMLPAKLDKVVITEVEYMTTTFMTHEDPDAKAAALQGLRAYDNEAEFSDSFYSEILKCITSPNKVLQTEALIAVNDVVPQSYINNIEFDQAVPALANGGEEAAGFIELITRKEKQAVKFVKHENSMPILMKAAEEALFDPAAIDESLFPGVMRNLSATEIGAKALLEHGAVQLLTRIIKDTKHPHNRAVAVEVLNKLGCALDELLDESFVNTQRANWNEWTSALASLPAHYSLRFLKSSEDLQALLTPLTKRETYADPYLQVVVNMLIAILEISPRYSILHQIALFTQNEDLIVTLLPNLYQQVDQNIHGLRLVCYALLSIVSNKVRAHVVDEGNITVLLGLLQNQTVQQYRPWVMRALSIIAYCSGAKFVESGGVDAFIKIGKQHENMELVCAGLFAVSASDTDIPNPNQAVDFLRPLSNDKKFPHHMFAHGAIVNLQRKTSAKDNKSKKGKKKAKPQATGEKVAKPKYQSLHEKLEAYCTEVVPEAAKHNQSDEQESTPIIEGLCERMDSLIKFIFKYTAEGFPETKGLVDFLWICFSYRKYVITIKALNNFVDILKDWEAAGISTLHINTRALMLTLPEFAKDFTEEKDLDKPMGEIVRLSNKFQDTSGGDNAKLNLLSQKLDHQQEVFNNSVKEHTAKITELKDTLSKEQAAADELKQTVKELEDKNNLLKTKTKALHTSITEKGQLIAQAEEKCKELEETLKQPPSEARLVEFVHQSTTIDPSDLFDMEKFNTLDQVKKLRARLKEKFKERKEALMREQKAKEDEVLKTKEVELEKLREQFLCPKCKATPKGASLDPCGHALCGPCASTTVCPVCHALVKAKHTFS